MFKQLIQKLRGRDAEIYCFLADPGRNTLKPNGFFIYKTVD